MFRIHLSLLAGILCHDPVWSFSVHHRTSAKQWVQTICWASDDADGIENKPQSRNLIRSGEQVPADYAAKQLTLNRIRDCAMTNKDNLMQIMRSPDLFTRRGNKKMDEIVEQLIVSAPLDRPTHSILMDGSWVQQGVVSPKTMEIKVNTLVDEEELQRSVGYGNPIPSEELRRPTVKTFRFVLSGLFAISRTFDFKATPNDFFTYRLTPRGPMRISVCGIFNVKVPKRFSLRPPKPVRILYLDSDLQIVCVDEGEFWSKPEVFLKPKEFNEQKELRLRKALNGRGGLRAVPGVLGRTLSNPLRRQSPFRIRDRLASLFKDAKDDAKEKVEKTPSVVLGSSGVTPFVKKGTIPEGGGLIGEINFFGKDDGKVSWATNEDVLGEFQDKSGFVVGDMLSGKLRRKSKKERESKKKKNKSDTE